MPKTGLSHRAWKERLLAYAAGRFKFGSGQWPSKGNHWWRELIKIDSCPRHSTSSRSKDIFGRKVECRCGYHKDTPAAGLPKDPVPLPANPAPVFGSSSSATAKEDQQAASRYPGFVAKSNKRKIEENECRADAFIIMSKKIHLDEPLEPAGLGRVAPTEASESTADSSGVSVVPEEPPQCTNPPLLPRQATSYAHRLPRGWEKAMRPEDREWVGRQVFAKKGSLVDPLKNWHHPPERRGGKLPVPGEFFTRRLFVWAPRMAYKYDFKCPGCTRSLQSKGLYNRVRLVLDTSSFYYLAAEYYLCGGCQMTLIAYDNRIMDQLPYAIRAKFPAVLTYKYACDRAIVSMLRSRTLGNSPSSLHSMLSELHTDTWLRKHAEYLRECQSHSSGVLSGTVPETAYQKADEFKKLPKAKWFLACYVRDVWTRLNTLKASITSTFGSIIKIDATKKVCKKLAGDEAFSANFAVNVGNERGEVLQSVLTSSESSSALQPMADGLMDRYAKAGVAPPSVLYTDRDCCRQNGPSTLNLLFNKWHDLVVRLDIWHFMRRLAVGCTSESHPLYGIFMSRLSGCIFEWDAGDVRDLTTAKKGELVAAGVRSPSEDAVNHAITSRELQRHCRRRTRSPEEISTLIEDLILRMTNMTDSLGVPIFREEINDIWSTEKKHVRCLQDPPDVPLYAVTGHVTKGGKQLPVYRCARGTTSLECFHLHIKNFIPGTSANAVNFQAYLIDGVTRWNKARKEAAENRDTMFRSFDSELVTRVNDLHASVHGAPLVDQEPPGKYTGEDFGVEFLHKQCDMSFLSEDIDHLLEEVFVPDDSDIDSGIAVDLDELPGVEGTLEKPDDDDELDNDPPAVDADTETSAEDDTSVNWRGIQGWDKVDRLAAELVSLRGISVTKSAADRVKKLYDELDEYDKRPLTFKSVVHRPSTGRFARSKNRSGHVGVDAMARCFITAGSPALPPSRSRIVEAICIHLLEKFPSSTTVETVAGRKLTVNRWRLILSAYNKIRARLLNSRNLQTATGLTLFCLNETQISRWFKAKTRREEITILLQGHALPGNTSVASDPLPAPRPVERLVTSAEPLAFADPEDQTGKARVRKRTVHEKRTKPVPSSVQAAEAQHQPISINSSGMPVVDSSSVASSSSTTLDPHSSDTVMQLPKSQTSTEPQSRTAAWRHQKKIEKGLVVKERKVYSCTFCKQPFTTAGHKHYYGNRYCPNRPDLPPLEEWLAAKKQERVNKKSDN